MSQQAANEKIVLPEVVVYSAFGAKGDGTTDDMAAIKKAHDFANQHNLPVMADPNASYYLGGEAITVVIQTDTDFGNARFFIDDTKVKNHRLALFQVTSKERPYKLAEIKSLKRNQTDLGVTLPKRSLFCATDSTVKRYIRYGANQNNGSAQTDVFLVEANGKVDPQTPIIWDFTNITELTVHPIDTKELIIRGGIFTTKANTAEATYAYYSRGISINRSLVRVENLQHFITDEGEHGAPYSGFISASLCADITVRDTLLTGHKTYRTIGSAGTMVSMGTYDISLNRAINVTFVNCRQSNSIHDRSRWGIMGSNYCKNLVYESCAFSRFDAHMGVANAIIRNSTLGHMGINAIGTGTFLVENSTINGSTFINLRSDYGSTWEGVMIIKNCIFNPSGNPNATPCIIGGHYSGQHDFGYTCHMPEQITIDGLFISDGKRPDTYQGAAIFSNFNAANKDASWVEKFPYIKTKEVVLKSISTASGKPLRISDNTHMFKDVKVIQ